jgi:hypothetical protein
MDGAPQQGQLADALPDETEAEAGASVHLTRFTIHPDRRAELVEAATSPVSSTEVRVGSHWKLLVALEDGDWLEISIKGAECSSDDASSYLDLADGIVGDEDGTIVHCARSDTSAPTSPRYEGSNERRSRPTMADIWTMVSQAVKTRAFGIDPPGGLAPITSSSNGVLASEQR